MTEIPLSKRLYEETKSVHEQVESMPFILALRNQKLAQKAYVQYLMDLKAIYEALEEEMKNHRELLPVKSLYDEKLCRSKNLENDLKSFGIEKIQPTEAAQDYVLHLKKLAKSSPNLLISHAYVRYMGDLSGGRMIKKFVEELFPGEHTSFYNFDELFGVGAPGAKLVEYKNEWKKHLDALEFDESEKVNLIEEAKMSFAYARKLFEAYTAYIY